VQAPGEYAITPLFAPNSTALQMIVKFQRAKFRELQQMRRGGMMGRAMKHGTFALPLTFLFAGCFELAIIH
jgi:hypothetical protein